MYLGSNRWRMTKKRRRPVNLWLIALLVLLIGAGLYFQHFIVPTIPPPFLPTDTPTTSAASFAKEAADLFLSGKLNAAEQAYRQAIQADPSNADLHLSLARVLVFDRHYSDALESAQNALLLNPQYAMAWAVYGWVLDFLPNRTTDAEKAVRDALQRNPSLAYAHAYLAEILADEGEWQDASNEARQALSLAPNLMESHRAMGYVFEFTANYTQAIQEYKAAVAIQPNWPPSIFPWGTTMPRWAM